MSAGLIVLLVGCCRPRVRTTTEEPMIELLVRVTFWVIALIKPTASALGGWIR